MALTAAPAFASTYINFTEFPLNTVITNQYATQGVIFAADSDANIKIDPPAGIPALTGGPNFGGDIDGVFVVPGTTTPATVDAFTLDIGYIDDPGSTVVRAFDVNGTLLGTVTANQVGVNHLTVAFPGTSSFLVTSISFELGGWTIHDLSFGSPTPPAPPTTGGSGASATTLSVSTAANPTDYGTAVTVTANLSVDSWGTLSPTGSVNFYDNGVYLDSSNLSSQSIKGAVAVLDVLAFPVGTNDITATYPGDANFASSTAPAYAQTVDAPTTVTVEPNINPSIYGQAVSFTALVQPAGGEPVTPSGSVAYSITSATGASVGCTNGNEQTLSDAEAVCNVGAGALLASEQPYTVSVAFGGASYYIESSGSVTQQVDPLPTTTSLQESINPALYGQRTTLVASEGASFGTPTGTVMFLDGGEELGTATLVDDVARLPYAFTSVGGHSLTAKYLGDGNYATSTSGASTETVQKSPTALTLNAVSEPSVSGQADSVVATVAPSGGGGGTPSGSVVFTVTPGSGPALACTGSDTQTLAGGEATCAISPAMLAAASPVKITATFAANADYLGSSGSLSHVVDKANTSTTVSSPSGTTMYGQKVVLTATVGVASPGAGTATGLVKFLDGSTVLGTVALDAQSPDTVALTVTTLEVGTHSITAVYGGDANFATSTSTAVTQTVKAAPTKLTAAPAILGFDPFQLPLLTLRATLINLATGGGAARQTVVFTAGSTPLCKATTDAAGVASCGLLTSLDVNGILGVLQADGYVASFAGTKDELRSSGKAGVISL